MLHLSSSTIETAVANQSSAMETDAILKNGRNPKSQMSRGNKYCLLFFVCLFFFGAFSTYAQVPKLRIAIIDLDYADPYSKNYVMNLTGLMITELVNTKKYIVLERSRVQQIINELGLQSTQKASARAAEIGNLLGVHKIITGEFIPHQGWSEMNLRLIDVESGSIEAAVSIDNFVRDKNGKAKFNNRNIPSCISDEDFVKKSLNALLN